MAGTACGGGSKKNNTPDAGPDYDSGPKADAEEGLPDGGTPDGMVEALAFEVTPASVDLDEGAEGTFTVALNRAPDNGSFVANVGSGDEGAVTVSPAVLTFDDANFGTPRTVTVTAVQDDDVADESVTVSVTGTGVDTADVAVSVTDDDTQAIVASTDAVAVQEEGTATFTVMLAAQPSSTVTVSVDTGDSAIATVDPTSLDFDDTDWDTPKTVTVSAPADADTANDSTTVTLSSSPLPDVDVTVNVTDNDTQNIFVQPGTLDLDEGGSAGTFTVNLTQQPSSTVTVTVSSPDEGAVTVSPTSIDFGSGDYDTPVTVTATPQDDPDALDEDVTVALSDGNALSASVDVTVADDETQAHLVSPTSLTVTEEGASKTFAVTLNADPAGNQDVLVTSPDPGAVSVTPGVLHFSSANYTMPHTVTVSGVSDPDLVDEDVDVAVSSGMAPTETVHVTVEEDDLQDLVVSTNDLAVVEDTGPNTFTVWLQYQPAGTVGVNIASDDTDIATVSDSQLLFTTSTYDTPQTVTVSGTSDNNLHDTSTQVRVTSPGLTDEVIDVNVTDDDVQDIVLTPASLSMTEGDVDTVAVKLAFEPYCDQASPGCSEKIAFSSPDDAAVSVAPASPTTLDFTAGNYNTAQTVTVTAVVDDDTVDEAVDLAVDSNEATTTDETLSVSVSDPDVQAFVFSDDPPVTTVDEGGADKNILVNLEYDPDPDNNSPLTATVTTEDETTLTVNDAAQDTLVFTHDNYDTPQTVTITAPPDVDLEDEAINVTFSAPAPGLADAIRIVTALDDDEQAILAADSLTVVEEATAELPVKLQFQPNSDRIVHVNEVSPDISLDKTSLTFTDANWDTEQTVTITGIADDNLDDENPGITLTTSPEVDPANRQGAEWSVDVTVDDNDVQKIVVTTVPDGLAPSLQEGGPELTFLVNLEFPPRTDGGAGDDQVEITSDNPDLSLSASGGLPLVFDTGNYDTPQTVTMTAQDDWEADNTLYDRTLEQNDDVTLTLTVTGEAAEQTAESPGPAFEDATQGVTIIDDELTTLESVVLSDYGGATRHTKRQNVNWARDTVVVTAYDNSSGETVLLTVPRDDLTNAAALSVSSSVADPSGVVAPVEAAEFDGTDVGVFASDSAGISYSRFNRNDLSAPVVGPLLAPADPAAVDFWPSFNGSEYGLLYRYDSPGDENLRFRSVALDGTTSSEVIVTTPTASSHLHPNLHPLSGGGWVALYTTATAVRCVLLDASGVPVAGSDTDLTNPPGGGAGIPAGAFVSSVIAGEAGAVPLDAMLAAYSDPTAGLSVAGVYGNDCSLEGVVPGFADAGGQLLNTPATAANGPGLAGPRTQTAVAFDRTDGAMGVAIIDNSGNTAPSILGVNGSRPSIVWVGDRWVLRAMDGNGDLYLESGSFESHCQDGQQNLAPPADAETGVDCGGNDCKPCL